MGKVAKTYKHWVGLFAICLMTAGTQGLEANTIGVYYTPIVEDLGILHGDFAINVTISALYVVLPKTFFGVKMGNYVYSYLIFFASIAVALSDTGIGYLHDYTGTYQTVFWIGVVLQVISAYLLWLTVHKAPVNKDK